MKRLTLTDDLVSRILLVRRARELAAAGTLGEMRVDLERVDLADAIVDAFIEQSADRGRQLPARASMLAPVVELRLTPKRRRRG